MDQEQQRREQLYETFKKGLTGETAFGQFDENDLIDIYDYACDIDDGYVQFEVIMQAGRLFPESNELTQRKAYFLFDNLSLTKGMESMVDKHENENALWDILSLLVKNQEGKEGGKTLDEIIETYDDFDDETVIQLVDAALDLGLYDWLWLNKDKIEAKCQYPSTFLYELSREAYVRDDFQNALKAIDELTSIDPFSEMYWHMLAQVYVQLDNQEEARQAIEYALALDPKSIEARITNAQILFDMNRDREGALEMVNQILLEDPDNPTACHTAVAMNLLTGHESKAKEILIAYLEKFPDDQKALERMFVFSNSSFSIEVLKEYVKISGMDETEWILWAKSYYDKGKYQQSSDILIAWLYQSGALPDWSILIESLYLQNRSSEIPPIYYHYIRDNDVALGPLEAYLLMTSLFEAKHYTNALDMAKRIVDCDILELPRLDLRLMALGAKEKASKLIELLKPEDKDGA